MFAPIYGNHAKSMSKLVANRDVLRGLDNLEWGRHVGRPRHARQKTIGFGWVGRHPRCTVLLLFRQSLWLVGDFTAFHNAESWRDAQLSSVILDIPGSRVQHLPYSVQVRFAVGGAGDACSRLRECAYLYRQDDGQEAAEIFPSSQRRRGATA